jgi:hypothetical protein
MYDVSKNARLLEMGSDRYAASIGRKKSEFTKACSSCVQQIAAASYALRGAVSFSY